MRADFLRSPDVRLDPATALRLSQILSRLKPVAASSISECALGEARTTRAVGNVIWLVLGGLWMALGYLIAALFMFVLIVTIPFGFQALKLASFSLWPFGRTLVNRPGAGVASLVGNVLWVVLAGWWIAIGHVFSAFLCAVTIIGIPFAVAHLKLAGTALWPVGREIVPIEKVRPEDQAIAISGP